jgi:uncharacterized protein (DUF362 family)
VALLFAGWWRQAVISQRRRVELVHQRGSLEDEVRQALAGAGLLERIHSGARIALKPNLTYPYHKRGVTTTPDFIRATVRVLRDYTDRIAIVETDGGYGAWAATEAYRGHGLYELRDEYGADVVNLCEEASEQIEFRSRARTYRLPLPVRLLHETDLFITLPVPKIHCMTRVTLSYKNQWGCIPDIMRLRRHYIFNDAIVAINRALRPAVLGDGTWFLDNNGPMEGDPVRMDLVIGASDAGAFDRYVSELMDVPWTTVPHLRRAVRLGDMPADLGAVRCNIAPAEARTHSFTLQRTARNWISLTGFRSRGLTWLGYESWFGRVVLHAMLYAVAGKPVKPQPEPARAASADSAD